MEKFKGVRILLWLSLICRLDFALMDTPPRLIVTGSIQERLDHSKVEADEINNLHFTERGQVAGSSGMVHISMQTNISSWTQNTRMACEIPDKMWEKIQSILRKERDDRASNKGNQLKGQAAQTTAENLAQAERILQYQRVHYTMKKR